MGFEEPPQPMTGAQNPDPQAEIDRLRTELQIANRQLVEAHNLASIGRLLASIVHEIDTPIGSIISNNEVVLRSLEMVRDVLASCDSPGLERGRKILDTCH